jgi:hypothetical protein
MHTSVPKLMLLAGLTLLVASAIHFGLQIPLGVLPIHDPFAGAAIPEAILGLVMLAGGLLVMSGPARAWLIAVACTGCTLLLTLYGASVTVRSRDWGDIVYHLALLTLLGAIVVSLVSERRTGATRVPTASN